MTVKIKTKTKPKDGGKGNGKCSRKATAVLRNPKTETIGFKPPSKRGSVSVDDLQAATMAAASKPKNKSDTHLIAVAKQLLTPDDKKDKKPVRSLPVKATPKKHPAPELPLDSDPDELVFTPRTWAKVVYLRDRGKSEVSGFGISHPDDPFRIIDFRLVPQVNTAAFTEFLDKALANYVEDMAIDEKIGPARCMRIWIHTHPNMTPTPSGHDEETFKRVNSASSWGIMCIIANDKEYARLRVNNVEGMSGERELRVCYDIRTPFEGVTVEDYEAWEKEYCDTVLIGLGPVATADTSSDRWDGRVWDGSVAGYRERYEAWACSGGDVDYPGLSPEDDSDFDLDGLLTSEVVCKMEEEQDGWFYVFTEQYWLQYGSEKEVYCVLRETLMGVDDVSQFPPHDWGTVVWTQDGTPLMYTKGGDDHALNEMRPQFEETVQERLAKDDDDAGDDEDDGDIEDAEAIIVIDPRERHPAEGHSGP